MAIQVNGTQVIGNSRELTNIASVDATTAAAIGAAGVGGGGVEGLYSWQVSTTADSTTLSQGPHTSDTNGNTVIICGSGGKIARSTNNGLTWSVYQAATTGICNLILYNPDLSQWVLTDADGRIYTSSNDGVSFTQRRSHVGFQAIVDMVWTGSKYVGVARGHASVSTNGTSWTNYAIGDGSTSAYYPHIRYDGTTFVASENYYALGQYYVNTSTNGTSWTRRQNAVTAISSLAYGNGVWTMLTGQKDCYTSTNGTSWTKRADTGIGIYNARWSGEYFVGYFQSAIAYSSDGISWYGQFVPSSGTSGGYTSNSTRHFFHHTGGSVALSDK